VVQRSSNHVTIRLDVRPSLRSHEATRIERYVRERCGEGVEVTLTTDEAIETTKGGKNRVVVRAFDR
jgi:hypothetical protein